MFAGHAGCVNPFLFCCFSRGCVSRILLRFVLRGPLQAFIGTFRFLRTDVCGPRPVLGIVAFHFSRCGAESRIVRFATDHDLLSVCGYAQDRPNGFVPASSVPLFCSLIRRGFCLRFQIRYSSPFRFRDPDLFRPLARIASSATDAGLAPVLCFRFYSPCLLPQSGPVSVTRPGSFLSCNHSFRALSAAPRRLTAAPCIGWATCPFCA